MPDCSKCLPIVEKIRDPKYGIKDLKEDISKVYQPECKEKKCVLVLAQDLQQQFESHTKDFVDALKEKRDDDTGIQLELAKIYRDKLYSFIEHTLKEGAQ